MLPREIWIVVAVWLSVVSSAVAGEVTVKVVPTEPDKVPFVSQLVAPGAYCAATGDVAGMVAVGHKVGNEAQISLFRLDAEGKPIVPAVVVKLPRSTAVGDRNAYPLSVVFHPTLPLLYVWQDVEFLKGNPPTDTAWSDFDHLLVYAIEVPVPELLVSLCRGAQFQTGNLSGALGLDVPHGRLYVPNLRFGPMNPAESCGVGWFSLGGDGLPIDGDDEPAEAEPLFAAEKAAAARPARVASLRASFAAGKPVGAFRHTPPTTYGFHDRNSGAGFVPVNRNVFVAGGSFGPVTWNSADRGARAQVFLMPVNFIAYYVTRIAPHPKLPVIYVTMAGFAYVHRIEHADGNMTLAPQVLYLVGSTLRTPPVVLTRRNLVAWGALDGVHLAHIDAAGRFTGEPGIRINFLNMEIGGVAYSEKFDRLYVAVEKAP